MNGLPPNVRVLSSLPRDHAGYSIANQGVMAALAEAEDRHFWHRARNAFIAGRLAGRGIVPPARFLELGCGGGSVSAHLSRVGYKVVGVDGHLPRIKMAAARAPEAHFFVHDLAAGLSPIGERDFDAVGLFDVLEHLDSPVDALDQALGLARRGGLVVGTVPALMSLWSDVDVHAGHRLRYERDALEMLLRSIRGSSVEDVAFFNRALVPLLALQRRRFRGSDPATSAQESLRVPWTPFNVLLRRVCSAEQALARALDRTRIRGASLWFALRRG